MFQFLYYLFMLATAVFLAFFLALYAYSQYQYGYWKRKKIPYQNPTFPLGNFGEATFVKSTGEVTKQIYDAAKGEPVVGVWSFWKPMLFVNDPDIIRQIFVKDFMSFHDRGLYVNEDDDPLAAHLFSMSGIGWRNLRVKLTPTFTSGKMRMMFQTIVDTGEELTKYMENIATNKETVEIKDILARFTTDVISSCAFGLVTNSLKNPESEFRRMGKRMLTPTFKEAFVGGLSFFLPEIAKFFKIRNTPKEVERFFMAAVKDTIEYRERNNIHRNDFMQLLIQLKNKGFIDEADSGKLSESDAILAANTKADGLKNFTMNQAAAQAFVFFLAGFETSSTTMQFALYELALNPDIQEKTREDIVKVLAKHDGKVTYEAIYEMEYLDRVVAETLRKYPPVPTLARECTKDCKLEGVDFTVPKGMIVQVPVFGIQRDPNFFPQPEKFDPDRFTESEKSKRHHYAYLPFGEGPRNCIGNRFGLLQSKVGLVSLLPNYRFEVSEKTPIPMKFERLSFVLTPVGGMQLKVVRRED